MKRATMNLALQFTKGALSLARNMFRPLNAATKRKASLRFFHELCILGSLLPRLISFTCVTAVEEGSMMFRPSLLSDLSLVLLSRSKEPYVQKVFRPNEGDTVVDVGAHIGFYTLKMARYVGPGGLVIAIEPDPENFLLLKSNIVINHFANVVAINAALSNSGGQRLFFACADPVLSGFQPASRTRIRDGITVRTVTLDKLLQDLGVNRVDWIKIDVEGEELRVLQGAKQVLESSGNLHVVIETCDSKTLQYLKEMGFRLRALSEIYYYAFKESYC